MEVTIGAPDGGRRHYQAVVSLRRPGGAEDAEEATASLSGLPPFGMSVDAAYRELLFHGPLFQAIAEIEGMDGRGAVSLLRASDPASCLAGADGSDWLLDPVLLDSALQVQVVWARLHWDVTLLPAEIASYRRALSGSRPVPAGELVRHEVVLRPDSAPPLCRMDHRFYFADGRLLATLDGVLGVGTAALNRLTGASA
jgi:Polyketide synthase dehydratase